MKPPKSIIAELKRILEAAGSPDQLNDHPWTQSLSVQQLAASQSVLQRRSPGYQLLATLSRLFRETMPSTPPRQGKRLDTRWGQFGILTALYFAPFEFSAVSPASLADAWGRIDQALPLYVFGRRGEELPEAEFIRYRLMADEADAAPTSTLSDWHIKGLERLAELFLSREAHLSAQLGRPSVVLAALPASLSPVTVAQPRPVQVSSQPRSRVRQFYVRQARRLWLTFALLVTGLSLVKAGRLISLAHAMQGDAAALQALANGPLEAGQAAALGPTLTDLRQNARALQLEAQPMAWAGPFFFWLPVYGGDLAALGPLLTIADGMAVGADEAYRGLDPIWQAQREGQTLSRADYVDLLVAAQPSFETARQAVAQAVQARSQIQVEHLSPGTRQLLLETVDPKLTLLSQGVDLAVAAPVVLGASPAGPQTYLLLLQNEDELRATGGFITAVGSVTLERGDPISFTVEESYAVDDLSQPYLPAPWPLDAYMASHIWLLRDSNWSPDFPSAAAMAEHDYAYTRFHAVDGVIALDQESLRRIVGAIGPLTIDGDVEPITGDNFIEHLRAVKDPAACGSLDPAERTKCKVFLKPFAASLLTQLQSDDLDWGALGVALLSALTERHILIQMDEPTVAAALALQGWDGAVRPGSGDYLRVVDSNLGFNKVNAAVTEQLTYVVDLSNPQAPLAGLTVVHQNPAPAGTDCQPGPDYGTGAYEDLINRCYWDYLRVYLLDGAQLISATPQAVPADWMLRGEAVPARVDELETLNGTRAWGTLLVVPGAETHTTEFGFSLPAEVLKPDGNEWHYALTVQKQAGTLAVPLTIRLRFPPGAEILQSSLEGARSGDEWVAALRLKQDISLEITFRVP